MKVILLHGPGKISVNSKALQIKSQFKPLEIKEINGKDASLGTIKTECLTSGLFSEKRLLVVENCDPQISLDSLPKGDDNLTLLVVLGNIPASAQILKSAHNMGAQIYFFPEAKEISVFNFLDLLVDQNAGALIEFEKLYREHGGQYLITMIFYQLRKLIVSPKKVPPFVLKKIANQKSKFPPPKIALLYKDAIEADFRFKSGLIDEKTSLALLIQKFLTA